MSVHQLHYICCCSSVKNNRSLLSMDKWTAWFLAHVAVAVVIFKSNVDATQACATSISVKGWWNVRKKSVEKIRWYAGHQDVLRMLEPQKRHSVITWAQWRKDRITAHSDCFKKEMSSLFLYRCHFQWQTTAWQWQWWQQCNIGLHKFI